MPIINSFISWLMKKRIHQIELFMKYPHEVQQEVFQKLITTASDTEWGNKYKYHEIKNYAQFSSRVPLQDYEDLKQYVVRLKQGEKNLLWPGEVKWFAKSSGTTNDKSKFIPVTREALEECQFKAGKDMLSIYCSNNPYTKIFQGKSLTIGGSRQINQFNRESYYGDLSAIIIKNLPFWADMLSTPEQSIALMENWEEKIEKIASFTSNENVTSITGVPSWALVILNKVLEINDKNDISEIWPNLEVFFHGGVSFTPYLEQFKNIISSPYMSFMETYNASEGFFGIQDTVHSKELLLMLDYGIFYEFIPISEYTSENPKVISLQEVEKNVNYAMLISTNGGLWRYKIGDTIQFTSLNPYRITISGRTKHFLNAFGEEVMIDNAEKALLTACQKTNAIVTDYTVAPVFLKNKEAGAHEWLIEFKEPPNDIHFFIEVLDNSLKAINSDYEAKRYGNYILQKPIVRMLPNGTFYEWMKQRGKLGGQNKVPKLSNDRKYVESILTFTKINL